LAREGRTACRSTRPKTNAECWFTCFIHTWKAADDGRGLRAASGWGSGLPIPTISPPKPRAGPSENICGHQNRAGDERGRHFTGLIGPCVAIRGGFFVVGRLRLGTAGRFDSRFAIFSPRGGCDHRLHTRACSSTVEKFTEGKFTSGGGSLTWAKSERYRLRPVSTRSPFFSSPKRMRSLWGSDAVDADAEGTATDCGKRGGYDRPEGGFAAHWSSPRGHHGYRERVEVRADERLARRREDPQAAVAGGCWGRGPRDEGKAFVRPPVFKSRLGAEPITGRLSKRRGTTRHRCGIISALLSAATFLARGFGRVQGRGQW